MRREPLVLFVVLGALIYGAWTLLTPEKLETIRIERSTLRALEQHQEELVGRPLNEEEKQEIVEGFIDDEVLLREALKRGLQWSDGRVRQRLIRIMRGALTETVADPSVAQLEAYFRDNIDSFTTPESISIEQVFFPWGDEVSGEELQAILQKLRDGADYRSFGVDSLLVRPLMSRQTRRVLVQGLGPAFADSIEMFSEGEWHGPLESVQGIHLVRVADRHAAEVATLEDVEPYLRQEWVMNRARELQQAGIDDLRSNYEIEIAEKSRAE